MSNNTEHYINQAIGNMRRLPTLPCLLGAICFLACSFHAGAQEEITGDVKVALTELDELRQTPDLDAVAKLVRDWRFETPTKIQKLILKLGVRSPDNIRQARFWSGLEQLVHAEESTQGLFRKEDNRTIQQRAYARILVSLERPFDPDLSKFYDSDRYALAKSPQTPRHVLQQLSFDKHPYVQRAAREQLKGPITANNATPQDFVTEGRRAQWAIEQLMRCKLPRSGAMTDADKEEHLITILETLIDVMNMPFDPDLSKLTPVERLKLAWSETTPRYVLEELSKDADPEVRIAYVQNREARLLRVSEMLADPDKRVVAAAKARYSLVWDDMQSKQRIEEAIESAAKGEQEVQKLMEASTQGDIDSLTRRWRFDTPPRLHKSIFAALLAILGSEKELPKLQKAEPPRIKPHPLSLDARLKVGVHIEKNPTLEDILERLGAATGLEIVLAADLKKGHDPADLRGVSAGSPKVGWPAWQLMAIVERTQLENGRWVKTDRGYRLEGKSAVPPAPAKAPILGNPLRYDSRLYAFAHVDPVNPSVEHIAERVSVATGLEMTISPALKNHQPKLGHIQPSAKGWRAYDLMEIATRKLANGRWEKTAAGYQLEGQALTPAPAPVDAPTTATETKSVSPRVETAGYSHCSVAWARS